MDQKRRSKSASAGSSGGSGDGAALDGGDSSSAYNTGTGGSSNSNHHSHPSPLTFKLGCNHTNRSILQLCSPTSEWTTGNNSYRFDNCRRMASRSSGGIKDFCGLNLLRGVTSSKSQPIKIPADTMYTNVANLQQTIRLQQQLFRQALNQRAQHSQSTTQFREMISRPSNISTFPGNAESSRRVTENDSSLKMEWKVKRRQNGTRYIARRPVRNRILKNRTKEIIEERASELTTEDETGSEIKLGRYWTKEERKRQMLDRERKLRAKIDNGKLDVNCKNCIKPHREPDLVTTQNLVPSTSAAGCAANIRSKSSDKKSTSMHRKKSHKESPIADDFKTVQEMIVHSGNRTTTSAANKMIGLLSVTTV